MKDPGPIFFGTDTHKQIKSFSLFVADKFGMAEPAVMGQVLKFYDALRKAAQSKIGMSSLKIEVTDSEEEEPDGTC